MFLETIFQDFLKFCCVVLRFLSRMLMNSDGSIASERSEKSHLSGRLPWREYWPRLQLVWDGRYWQRDMKIQQKHRSSQRVPVFLARLARFERAALRLGVLKKVLCQSSSEFVKALFFNAGSSQSVFWRSSEIACFCLKIPSKIRWRLDDLRKLLGPFRHLTHFLDNRNPKSKWFGTQPQLTAIEADVYDSIPHHTGLTAHS